MELFTVRIILKYYFTISYGFDSVPNPHNLSSEVK